MFAHLGDVTASSRALRQLRVLAAEGLPVTVVQVGPPRSGASVPAGLDLRVLPRPAGRGPAFFAAAHRLVRRAVRAVPAALYLASDLYVLPACAAAARRHGGRVVYDSRELYAGLDVTAGRPLVARVWQALERRAIRHADAVLTVNGAIADRLAETYAIERPTVLYNAPEHVPQVQGPGLRERLTLPDDSRLVVLYQGLFRRGRGLETLLDAARTIDDVRVVLIGEGDLESELRGRGAPLGDRLVIHPFVPPDALAALTPGADLGACLIEPLTESLRLSLPNKLFEYLSAGVPVLASPLPEIRAVLAGADAGILADPHDPTAVAGALRQSLDPERRRAWAENSRAAVAPYAWTSGRDTFRRLILDLLAA